MFMFYLFVSLLSLSVIYLVLINGTLINLYVIRDDGSTVWEAA